MKLTRCYRFCASHRLHSSALSEAENEQVYGKCNNPFGHGHDYVLELTVAGQRDERTGRLIDIEKLDRLVNHHLLSDLDHIDLNSEVPEFATLVPTSENLAIVIAARLRENWTFATRLDTIRLQETKRNRFELRS